MKTPNKKNNLSSNENNNVGLLYYFEQLVV
jgi:hypothetical protein